MNMKSFSVSLLLLVATSIFCTSADAIIHDITAGYQGNGNSNGTDIQFDKDLQTSDMYQSFFNMGPSTIDLHLANEGTSQLNLAKHITNDTGTDWTGYKITLSGNLTILEDSIHSSLFEDFVLEGNTITFSNPTEVIAGNGTLVDMNFAIVVSNDEILSQINPVNSPEMQLTPEPATVLLLGFGALAARRQRRKNR